MRLLLRCDIACRVCVKLHKNSDNGEINISLCGGWEIEQQQKGFLLYSQNPLKNQAFYAILRNRCKGEICNLQRFIEAISDKWG